MKHYLLISLLFPALLIAQDKGNYPSLPSKVLSNYAPPVPEKHTPDVMAEKASAFLAALDGDLKKQAALAYDSAEKGYWTNVPPRGPQGGVRLGDLNEKQLQLACDLLAAVLSPQGYGKAINIPLADDRLLRNGERRPGFGAEDYWLAIFGEPTADSPWALQLDGHHLAINLAFQGDAMSMSPTFIGTQPFQFSLGKKNIEPMADKDTAALELLLSLGEDQRKKAIVGDTRGNLVAGAGRDGRVPKPQGVSCDSLNEASREKLMALISLYVGDLPEPYANKRLGELRAEINKMTFGWWGPAEKGGDYSYRLQGPTLIIEYAGQDLGGDPHDHLHSMYRDPTNEYGARLGGN